VHIADIRQSYADGNSIEMIRIAFETDRQTVLAALRGAGLRLADDLQDRIDLRLADDPNASLIWLVEPAPADLGPAETRQAIP
jgi:hypothetical protein